MFLKFCNILVKMFNITFLMKLFLFIFCFLVLGACKNVREKQIIASEYNNEIIKIQHQVDSALLKVLSNMETYETKKILISYEISRTITNESIEKANNINKINNDNSYKNALLTLLNMYYNLYETELSELIDIYLKNPNDIGEKDIEYIYELYSEIEARYINGKSIFLQKQKIFAKKWNLKLEENKNYKFYNCSDL